MILSPDKYWLLNNITTTLHDSWLSHCESESIPHRSWSSFVIAVSIFRIPRLQVGRYLFLEINAYFIKVHNSVIVYVVLILVSEFSLCLDRIDLLEPDSKTKHYDYDAAKYLEVVIDSSITWKKQYNQINQKS